MWFVGRQKRIYSFGIWYAYRHHGVRKDKTIITNHNRSINFFGNTISLNDCIDYFLVVPAIELNPAGIALGDRILLVIEYRPGCADAAIHAAHDNGQA